MHARANILSADPAKLDDGINFVRDQVMPALEPLAGYRGLTLSADRESGAGSLVTFWDGLESLRASESAVASLRTEAADRFGGTVTPQVAEVAEQHMRETPSPGMWVRVTALEMDSSDIPKSLDAFRSSTVPGLEAMDGFCGATLNIDVDQRAVVAVTVWRDREAVEASRERASGLRQEVADKAHGTVSSVQEAEIILTRS